ncbi:MAG: hypothetical protein RIA09_16190 [Hoeflea sp.]|jgi:hypothetical protein|uniref:hypothetical protein n=1 Tax=Hoeflea sp. TaxID=1940281 RepID=UPI0032F0206B
MRNAVHFVGFRGDEFNRAVRVFGQPDFIHNVWDKRAVAEVFEGDTVVLGPKGQTDQVFEFTYDDSSRF